MITPNPRSKAASAAGSSQATGSMADSSSRGSRQKAAPKSVETTSAFLESAEKPLPIAIDHDVRRESGAALNQLLADTMTLRDLYKKHHWQVTGPTFYSLHLLFDKHYQEQSELVDAIAERIRILGGISVAMAADVAEMTQIPRPPMGKEPPAQQISRLLQAHEIVLLQSHSAAKDAQKGGDDGTNDLLVSEVIRTNELQAWFIGEHLVNMPYTGASTKDEESKRA